VQAISAFQVALQHNPQNIEVSMKTKRLTQLAREKKRALDVESMRSNIDIGRNFESLKTELVSLLLRFVDVIFLRRKAKARGPKVYRCTPFLSILICAPFPSKCNFILSSAQCKSESGFFNRTIFSILCP
jgi:hypothetical protein